jgi:hypothetical protein
MREMERALRTLYIENPTLRREVNEFYTRCYVPARSKYLEQQPAAAAPILVAQGTRRSGLDRIARLPHGARVLRYLGGGESRSPACPSTWRGTPTASGTTPRATIEHGIPYCNEWWEHPSHGLRTRLIDDNSRTQRIWTWVSSQFSSVDAEQRRDLLSRRILEAHSHLLYAVAGRAAGAGTGSGMARHRRARMFHGGVASVGLVTFYNLVMEPT